MKFTLYHNKNCSKSRACLLLLEERKIDFFLRDYLREPLKKNEIIKIIDNLLGNKMNLLRKVEKNISEKNLADHIFRDQKNLQRPIFFDGKNFIICRPPDKVLDHLEDL